MALGADAAAFAVLFSSGAGGVTADPGAARVSVAADPGAARVSVAAEPGAARVSVTADPGAARVSVAADPSAADPTTTDSDAADTTAADCGIVGLAPSSCCAAALGIVMHVGVPAAAVAAAAAVSCWYACELC